MRWIKVMMALACLGVVSACSVVTGGPLVRPGEPTGVLEIANGSSHTLTVILIADCSGMSYGLNRLPSGSTIPPGRSYRFTTSAGCWDVSAGLAYGTTIYETRFTTQVRPGRLTRHTVTGR